MLGLFDKCAARKFSPKCSVWTAVAFFATVVEAVWGGGYVWTGISSCWAALSVSLLKLYHKCVARMTLPSNSVWMAVSVITTTAVGMLVIEAEASQEEGSGVIVSIADSGEGGFEVMN